MIISYDFGTTSVKAALFDIDGNVVSSAIHKYPLLYPKAGWVEQNPDDWWNAMSSITAELVSTSNIKTSSISAINICAQMCGTLPVDINGKPLTNCLTWLDTRSEEIARRITKGIIHVGGYGLVPLLRWLWITHGAPNLSGRDPISKILWLREQSPGIWKHTHKILDVKDYLLYRCSGRYITTPDSAHLTWLMDSRPDKKCWSAPLLSRLDINPELLPEICKSTDIIGVLHANAAAELGLTEGIIVMAGAGDVTASALGAGSISISEPHLHIGTSAWSSAHVNHQIVDVYNNIGSICAADPDNYLLIAAQQSGGLCLDWASRQMGMIDADTPDYVAINTLVEGSELRASNPLFLPWLMGECVPRKIPLNRAGFVNLSHNHNKQDIFRAIMEGVAMNIRWAYLKMNNLLNNNEKNIRFLGGGANSQVWCQILANILQSPVLQMDMPHLGGARGVAMLASVALGWHSSLDEAVKTAKIKQTFYPDQDTTDYYEERFIRFLNHYRLNKSS
jgi:xylulokinase